MGIVASAADKSRKAGRAAVTSKFLVTLFVTLNSLGIFSTVANNLAAGRAVRDREHVFRLPEEPTGLISNPKDLSRLAAGWSSGESRSHKRQQPKQQRQLKEHFQRHYKAHQQQLRKHAERHHRLHSQLHARRQRPRNLTYCEKYSRFAPSAQSQTSEAGGGDVTSLTPPERAFAMGATKTDCESAAGLTRDGSKAKMTATTASLRKTEVFPAHDLATEDHAAGLADVTAPDVVDDAWADDDTWLDGNTWADDVEEVETSVSGDDQGPEASVDLTRGIGANGRRVKFSATACIRRTFSEDQYDRTAVPLAKLSFADYLELLQIKSELKSHMEDAVQNNALEKGDVDIGMGYRSE